MVVPSYEIFCKKAREGNLIPIYREVFADTETPVSAFLKIKGGGYSYLLESVEGGEKWGRYSFLGTDPLMIVRGCGSYVEVTQNGSVSRIEAEGNPLLVLKRLLSEYKPVEIEGLPRFFGGAVGAISYEAARFFEPVRFKAPTQPDFLFLLTDTLIIFDNVRHCMKVVSNVFLREGNLKEAYDRAVSKIEGTMSRLSSPLMGKRYPATAGALKSVPQPISNLSRDEFKKAVLIAKEYIKAGDIFQVQLSQRFSTELTCDPFMVYRALRSINPSPYMYYLQFDQCHLVGSSPEVLVRLEGEEVTMRPIAGTRRRGVSTQEDIALEAELLSDPKERAEHVMLIDLGRNDMGRACRYGTVNVDELMVIERYSHVMHIVSNIVGRLDAGKDALDLLFACFPAGTVTGAPKIRAMEIIDELEPEVRGFYAGAVGYISFQGNMDTCITIRTIVIDGRRATIQAAAGIVADSDPDREYEETLNKVRAMLTALEIAQRDMV